MGSLFATKGQSVLATSRLRQRIQEGYSLSTALRDLSCRPRYIPLFRLSCSFRGSVPVSRWETGCTCAWPRIRTAHGRYAWV